MNLEFKSIFLVPALLASSGSTLTQNTRITTYEYISKKLASFSDQEIQQLLKKAQPLGASGITGTVFCLEIKWHQDFCKEIVSDRP